MRSHEGGLGGSDSAKGGDWSGSLQSPVSSLQEEEEEVRQGQTRQTNQSSGLTVPPSTTQAALVEWTAPPGPLSL